MGTHRLHDVREDSWVAVSIPATEAPERADAIRDALTAAGAQIVEAKEHSDEALFAVHSPELVRFLSSAWDDWQREGMLDDPGQERVVAYIFPTPGLTAGRR
jgi:acetoin utilization deacetylase AcuC-like enzyme